MMNERSCLWVRARAGLPENIREWVKSLERDAQPRSRATHQIDHKFKGIGDVVSSFDPVHAALPWAAFRFVLQAIVAGKEYEDSLFDILALIPNAIFSGRVLEMVYTQKSMHIKGVQNGRSIGEQRIENLHNELIKLYASVLIALEYSYSALIQKRSKRRVVAIFRSSEPVDILN
ncbi:NADH-cytochrome b5 reductase 1 [Fusarium oxysporum f. sp. albedinis]|nr:NADH-cytochrome b5 reductase 1 [Fusarium oxysporum f. sp. albedinis]